MLPNLHFRIVLGLIFFCFLAVGSCSEKRIDFNAEIRPIFNEHCVSCHGGVKQSGGFGLVFRENALKETDNGKLGIAPGDPQNSELYQRIIHHDIDERMPLEEEALPKEDIEKIKKWIEQGAEWKEHWAYLPLMKYDPPKSSSTWIRNDIDRFIFQQIKSHRLEPSPEADKHTLLRRLYLDLTGLPPSLAQAEAFLQDSSTLTYEKLVDSLLASPRFGEHWASMWLDIARYADSFGYSADIGREIWQYRDWVIKALNQDMPFDQFTIEQLAGDLLPNPSMDQLIATGFNRACLTNGEGGANHEENRNVAVIDRVNTTWEAWQGMTMGCVQCHNHPYDPIKQTDFYQGFAFFNNTNDHNLRADFPILRTLQDEDEQKLEELKQWVMQYGSEEDVRKLENTVRIHEPKVVPMDFSETHNTKFYNRTGDDYMSVYDGSYVKLGRFDLSGIEKLYFNYIKRTDDEGFIRIHLQSADGPMVGKAAIEKSGWGFKVLSIPIDPVEGEIEVYASFESKAPTFEVFIEGFFFGHQIPGKEAAAYPEMANRLDSLVKGKAKLTSPIMFDKPRNLQRTTQVFERGNWLTKGTEVNPGVPALLANQKEQLTTRLDLAEWLVSKENPLTARVTVNRIWAQLFGKGIVQTLEDFGTMGEKPTHPKLLDWMALHFMEEQGWSLKELIKNIVLSATYRQGAKVSPEALEKDPNNIWLARSPRTRLSAEQVRDQALLVSGLLSYKMYGPGVKPVQPDGIWKISFSNEKWKVSEGEDRYRRAVYTYLKRSALYPSFLTFDASGREVCLSRRISTNTPLQALVTLNDPVYFEAAQHLAAKALEIEGDLSNKLTKAYEMIMGKSPKTEKVKVLLELHQETQAYYSAHPEEAEALVGNDNQDLAVMTVLANSLMNMDEFIVRS